MLISGYHYINKVDGRWVNSFIVGTVQLSICNWSMLVSWTVLSILTHWILHVPFNIRLLQLPFESCIDQSINVYSYSVYIIYLEISTMQQSRDILQQYNTMLREIAWSFLPPKKFWGKILISEFYNWCKNAKTCFSHLEKSHSQSFITTHLSPWLIDKVTSYIIEMKW